MRAGRRPRVLRLRTGERLTEQGEAGSELFLLLNGVLAVEVDGRKVAEVGPGALLGERALLEQGRRTATLRAQTPATVAVASAGDIADEELLEVAEVIMPRR